MKLKMSTLYKLVNGFIRFQAQPLVAVAVAVAVVVEEEINHAELQQ
jgi:hypothetical protein